MEEEHILPIDTWDDSTDVTFKEYIILDKNMDMCRELSHQYILADMLNKKSATIQRKRKKKLKLKRHQSLYN